MARLRGHRTLDYAQPLFVRRAELTVNGHTFTVGDPFDWRALDLAPSKVHQLWTGRRVGHEMPGDRNGAESVSALVSPAPTVPPAVTVQPGFVVGGSIEVPLAPDASQHVDFKAASGETVHVTPPSKPFKRR